MSFVETSFSSLAIRLVLLMTIINATIIHRILDTNSSFHVSSVLRERFNFHFSRVFC